MKSRKSSKYIKDVQGHIPGVDALEATDLEAELVCWWPSLLTRLSSSFELETKKYKLMYLELNSHFF